MAYSLNYLYSWKRNVNNKKYAKQQEIRQLDEEIARLQSAYNSLNSLKNGESKRLKKDVRSEKCAPGVSWRGQYKTEFDNILNSDARTEAVNLNNQLDDMQDAVNMEITRRKNQRSDATGSILGFDKTLRTIGTYISNWFN